MYEKITETVPTGTPGRSALPSKSAFALAIRESGPTPVVTHSGDVSRLEPTTSMVLRRLRSQVLGGRSSAAIPDVEVRPETEFRQEPEMDNPAEIEVPCPPSVKWIWAPLDQLPLKNRQIQLKQ